MKKRLKTPGAKINEARRGPQPIRAAPTSITAFIGRTRQGPAELPTPVRNFAEFTRLFGGLWSESTLSYAVEQYFANGGSDALIVRLENSAVPAQILLPGPEGSLLLRAINPGAWGNTLQARVVHDGTDTFQLEIAVADQAGQIVQEEKHPGLSVRPGAPRFVRSVLERESPLVRFREAGRLRPDETGAGHIQAGSGSDGYPITEDQIFSRTLLAPRRYGLWALNRAAHFNLLCIPPLERDLDISPSGWRTAEEFCRKRRAFLLVDPPSNPPGAAWETPSDVAGTVGGIESLNLRVENAAMYYPRILAVDPFQNAPAVFAPCGAVAGVIARTDREKGVWKAPAGLEAGIHGITGFEYSLNDSEAGLLNPLGVNALRTFSGIGPVVWGARTLMGADHLASEWKYVPVRRLGLFVEESIDHSLDWAVFEPNDEPLWASVRTVVEDFMFGLFRQGALQGSKPEEAFFVRCDRSTTTHTDIEAGYFNLILGFAPLKPAEFVVLRFKMAAGQGAAKIPDSGRITANTTRFDPYKNFKFRIRMGGQIVAGFQQASGLKRGTRAKGRESLAISRRRQRSAGFEAITLERGLTHDPVFEQWANGFVSGSAGNDPRDLIIETYDEAGEKTAAFSLSRCRVTQYQALPEMDSGANAVAIETLTIQHEKLMRTHPPE